MRKAYELIGLPVLDNKTGKRFGRIRDLIIGDDWLAQGVLLDYKQWFSPARYVKWDEIAVFGDDAVMISGKASIQHYVPAEDHFFLIMGKRKVKGTPLVTKEGVHLGRVEDVYFSQKMDKRIVSYELSDGFLNDWREGRKQLPIPVGTERGEDVILVPVHRLEEANEAIDKE